MLRELLEETGIEGSAPRLLTAYLIKGKIGLPHTSIDIIYKVDAEDPVPFLCETDEVQKVSFFSTTQLPEKIAFGHRDVINNFPDL